jgi:hypothetical protein
MIATELRETLTSRITFMKEEPTQRSRDAAAESLFASEEVDQGASVVRREIEEQNRIFEKKRESLRRAGERVAEEFGKLDFVYKVVLFGSIAKPPYKEVPRFRGAGVKLWHESKDVDLLVWVSDIAQLDALRLARGRAVNLHQLEAASKCWPGVPHHQVDVFLLEEGTNRYRGNLCIFGTCPKGHAECNDAGCGAQSFLRIYEGFHFDRNALFGEHNQLLFLRERPAK